MVNCESGSVEESDVRLADCQLDSAGGVPACPAHFTRTGSGAVRRLRLGPKRDHIPLEGGLVKVLFGKQQPDKRSIADCVVGKIHDKANEKSARN